MTVKLAWISLPKTYMVCIDTGCFDHASALHNEDMNRDTEELPAIITDLERSIKTIEKSQ